MTVGDALLARERPAPRARTRTPSLRRRVTDRPLIARAVEHPVDRNAVDGGEPRRDDRLGVNPHGAVLFQHRLELRPLVGLYVEEERARRVLRQLCAELLAQMPLDDAGREDER